MRSATITLTWKRFNRFTEARNVFKRTPCVYVQTDADGRAFRVGKASKGLEPRYRGGTGYALDAAMHDSGNLVFVAEVAADLCEAAEAALIWKHREVLVYNNFGKLVEPARVLVIEHAGERPTFMKGGSE